MAPADGNEPDQLLRNADMAPYRAKSDGRGTYHFFQPEMDAQMLDRRKLELDLRKALQGDEFELNYQPLIDLARGEVCGFEALLCWKHPERGLVSPEEFIPVAEEIGLIVPLGDWVLKQACRDAASWPAKTAIAVNLSPVQFRNPMLALSVVSALGQSGLRRRASNWKSPNACCCRPTATCSMRCINSATSACGSVWTISAPVTRH